MKGMAAQNAQTTGKQTGKEAESLNARRRIL
jgi:hypothetical protein